MAQNPQTLDSTGTFLLNTGPGQSGPDGLQLIFTVTGTNSLVLKKNTAPPGSAQSLSNIAYVNGSLAAQSAGTAVTASGIAYITPENAGFDIYATNTWTSGAVVVRATPSNLGASSGAGGTIPAADVTAGTFGANTGDVGDFTFPDDVVVNDDADVVGDLTAGTIASDGALSGTGATVTSLTVNGAAANPAAVVTTTGAVNTSLRYDASNKLDVAVSSAGAVTYNATGASASHTFSDDTGISGALTVAGGSASNALSVTTTGAVTARFRYDASNLLELAVSSAGAATYNATGASAGHTFSDPVTVTGGLKLATQPTIYAAAGGMWQLATAGTDSACTNGTSYFVELNIPYNQTLTGLAYQVGSVGGTDSVIVVLYNSAGTVVANSALAGETVGTAAQIQSVAFLSTYAAVAGRYFASVTFNGVTAKFRTYPIPGSAFIAGSEAETFGTVTAITPGTTFTAANGPLCYVY